MASTKRIRRVALLAPDTRRFPPLEKLPRPLLLKAIANVSAMVFVIVLGLALPYLLKVLIDKMMAHAPLEEFLFLGGVGVAVLTCQFVLAWAQRVLASGAAEEGHRLLRDALLERVLAANMLALKSQHAGELATLLENDTRELVGFYESFLPSLVQTLVLLLGTGAILFWMEPRLSAMLLLPLPILGLLLILFERSIRKRIGRIQQARGRVLSTLFDALSGLDSLKVYTGESFVKARVARHGKALSESRTKLAYQQALLFPALNLGLGVAMLGALVAGGYFAASDEVSVGSVAAFYVYLSRTLAPIRGGTELIYGWNRYRTSRERISRFLEHALPLQTVEHPSPLPESLGALRLEQVGFSYKPSEPVLEEIDLEIGAGQWVAILGPSGAGKSTLGKLIPRLFDPSAGRIHYGSAPFTDLDPLELRRKVGYVGQEVLLFEGSFRENLLFGIVEDVEEEHLQWVLDVSRVSPIVDEREDGLESMLGQGGGDLSGGQKKRVALARALLRKPEVIVIDQMASDLEASLNREIFTRLSREFEGAILYLGHRVPDGFVPDAVYWLEDGRLAPREHLA